jgi:hypothetical protein
MMHPFDMHSSQVIQHVGTVSMATTCVVLRWVGGDWNTRQGAWSTSSLADVRVCLPVASNTQHSSGASVWLSQCTQLYWPTSNGA